MSDSIEARVEALEKNFNAVVEQRSLELDESRQEWNIASINSMKEAKKHGVRITAIVLVQTLLLATGLVVLIFK